MKLTEVTNMPTKEEIHSLVLRQKEYFNSKETFPIMFRIEALKKLKEAVIKNQEKIEHALHLDLGRADAEAYFCDIGSVILEINECIHNLKRWAKPENHYSGFASFPSMKTKVYKIPYGVSLIIAPFNFPFLLSLGVLAASISGGNTSIIKASSKSVECTKVLKELIAESFNEEYITVIDGGHDVADFLLEEKVDKIFYTGSPNVGKHVMEMASKNLVPVTLELGGETGNFAIVRKDADLKDAARKIAFFKLLNSGQVCININHVAVASEVADEFVNLLREEFVRQIGEDACKNDEYPKLINERAYLKIAEDVEKHRKLVVFGGTGDQALQKYNPTILYPVDINDEIVNHEIFGPILPVIRFEDEKIDELIKVVESREHGLALYLFTKDMKWAKKMMSTMQYGGGCINEVCVHLMVKGVPFNGVGHSGMGGYHGEWGFKAFTHPSTVLFGKRHLNLPLREHPYTKTKKKLFKAFLK